MFSKATKTTQRKKRAVTAVKAAKVVMFLLSLLMLLIGGVQLFAGNYVQTAFCILYVILNTAVYYFSYIKPSMKFTAVCLVSMMLLLIGLLAYVGKACL